MRKFKLVSRYSPQGDQPEAIRKLTESIRAGHRYQTLLGVTGSGKTFTMAHTIAALNMPTLIISHNKTLAAQLYGELKSFFPENAVEYFISYYDYYQPEAYIPQTDTYIEKDASINEEIDRLRLKATASLLERDDVIIVASVSCIYGLGSPKDYRELLVFVNIGEEKEIQELLRQLVNIHYTRNDIDFWRGSFRVRGDVVEIYPAYEDRVIRIEFFGDTVDRISIVDPLTGEPLRDNLKQVTIYPARHFLTTRDRLLRAIDSIKAELEERLEELRREGKLLEAERLDTRTRYDIEMMLEIGYCPGIENYSRHIAGRAPGSRPSVLLDYFPKNFLVFIDESHVTVPQLRGMYRGDRARKETLIEYGFRLPSCLDNRPLFFEEFLQLAPQIVFVSATPGDWEIKMSESRVIEQLVRPTGLVDPKITIKPTKGQIEDLLGLIRERVKKHERVLVTTLTKRTSEELAEYLAEFGIKVRYLHSEIQALERVEILRGLRLGEFDVLVGVNLLREGLDLPEVSLVAILDADREGFLRSKRSLIQIAGRAARNAAGEVILYADKQTDAMKAAIAETERRRSIQIEFNKKHHITPRSIKKAREEILETTSIADVITRGKTEKPPMPAVNIEDKLSLQDTIHELTKLMKSAAEMLDFEKAAFYRDEIKKLRKAMAKR
ncbi:excinuclease ABC subunit UvrB [bacterium]|nr:excinuclease ABC subunit UvrB [bacterium]